MPCSCCASTTVQRLLVRRRSEAHDREMQRNQMKRKRRCNVASVVMVLGYLLTNGHLIALVVSAALLSPSQLLEHSLLVDEQQWVPEPLAAGGVEPWLRETLQEKLDAAERAGDEGAVKKIRALCPELVSTDRGDGGVDLWISLTRQMATAAATEDATGRGSGTTQAQGSRAGKKERLRLGSPVPSYACASRTQRKNRRRKWTRSRWTSLDFGHEESKKAYQDALKL